MRTLYEIGEDYLQLLEMLEEDDVDDQVLKDTLEGIEGEFEIKADNYARIIKELDAEAEKYGDEIGRMQQRMKVLGNGSKMLKRHLYDGMKATGKLKFKTDLFSFGIHKNGGRKPMTIFSNMEIPDEYCKKEPDGDKIRAALESGQTLSFAVLEDRGDHLTIR